MIEHKQEPDDWNGDAGPWWQRPLMWLLQMLTYGR